jgi:hypothetical protein
LEGLRTKRMARPEIRDPMMLMMMMMMMMIAKEDLALVSVWNLKLRFRR